jgi:hypothetical protein
MSETASRSSSKAKEYGIVIGTLIGLSENRLPLVSYHGKTPVPAQTLVNVGEADFGKSVVLQFESGDIKRPVLLGVLQDNRSAEPIADDDDAPAATLALADAPIKAKIDDAEIVLTAQRRITLQCGSASITLDANGNVEIRGKYILSRSSGQNRIKGSSVSLN